MKLTQKQHILIVGIVTFVIAAGLVGTGWYYNQYKVDEVTTKTNIVGENINSTNQNANINTSTVNTSNWQTYTNEEPYYKISYPENLKMEQPVSDVFIIRGDNEEYLQIQTFNSSPSELRNPNGAQYVKNIELGGKDAKKYHTDTPVGEGAIELPFTDYEIILSDNQWVDIRYFAETDNGLFENILTTLIFADTSGWQTYTNDNYGFSFQYPSNWGLTENDGINYQKSVASITSPKTQKQISDTKERLGYCEGCGPDISFYYYPSIEEERSNKLNNLGATSIDDLIEKDTSREKLGERTIGGLNAVAIKSGGFGVYYELLIDNNGAIYEIFFNNWDLQGMQLTPIEENILNTFTFLKDTDILTNTNNQENISINKNASISAPNEEALINGGSLTNEDQEIDTTGWTFYTDPLYGFTIKFPPEWEGYIVNDVSGIYAAMEFKHQTTRTEEGDYGYVSFRIDIIETSNEVSWVKNSELIYEKNGLYYYYTPSTTDTPGELQDYWDQMSSIITTFKVENQDYWFNR